MKASFRACSAGVRSMAAPMSGDVGGGDAAIDRHNLRGYKATLVTCEEANRLGDVVDRAEPPQRRARDTASIELDVAVSHRAFGRNGGRRHRIDPDPARAKLRGSRPRDPHDTRLDTAIDDTVLAGDQAGDRGDVDDGAAAFRIHRLGCCLNAPDD